jgi:hypothetical protein
MSGSAAAPPELTAICHLLSFDTGLFCISLAEPPPPSFASPHFPGVRLSLPPGPVSEHKGVTISTFREDGWLDMDRPAALVHVLNGPARLLLTIYHEADQPREAAPKLVISQLTQGIPQPVRPPPLAQAQPYPAAAPVFMPMTPTPAQVVTGFPTPPQTPSQIVSGQPVVQAQPPLPATPLLEGQIVAHIRNRGDVRTRLDEWVGLPGSRLWVEGFGIVLPGGWSSSDLEYQGVIAKSGATQWIAGPEYCGSRAQTLPLLGFAIRLRGTVARHYGCSYRASFIDGTSAGPVQQGQICQSPSGAAVEAFQLTLSPL